MRNVSSKMLIYLFIFYTVDAFRYLNGIREMSTQFKPMRCHVGYNTRSVLAAD